MERELARKIGAAARGARRALGRTQADTAEEIGISPDFYARIERGSTMPSVETLRRIAEVLQVGSDVLLGLQAATRRDQKVTESADMRRLLTRLQSLPPRSVRLLAGVAHAMSPAASTRQASPATKRAIRR